MSTLTAQEGIKTRSQYLRGTLKESLADGASGALAGDDTFVVKFHGSYIQDDRDSREERRAAKLEPDWTFMIRTRTPGGVLTPSQWLGVSQIARDYGNQGLRLTTRQAIQFHGIIKRELKATMAAINAQLIDTIAACGDVNRNVLCSPNPVETAAHAEVFEWSKRISEHLLPNTRAYHEIWLDGEKQNLEGVVEPIYGPTYLPRKFKTAVVIPPQNDVDVYAHDLGFIAIIENGQLQGFNVSVGGGLGTTHGNLKTYPRLADIIGFVTPEQTLAFAEAVLTTQRDFGDRTSRDNSKLKYTIIDRGLDWFKAEVERRLGFALPAPRPVGFTNQGDRFGWIEGHDGRWHLNLRIPAGRIRDEDGKPWLSGLEAIAGEHVGDFRVTPNQNLVIANVPASAKDRIDALVRQYALDLYEQQTPLQRDALACVALPTCPLAMAEAERYLPDLLGKVSALQAKYGLLQDPLVLRITGCPNGCARPYLAEVALIGKAAGRYNLLLGGSVRGDRLTVLYRENIAEPEFLSVLDGLLGRYAAERETGERFGDFVHRVGVLDGLKGVHRERGAA
ncbi:sulfite reductase [Ahniella affigens]|uniref:Sulfite reductase [NADPH] hemoprotein beta-component n=1 Tax=Ahniella affigens TaxID=2021234 RepID=A0A2P1PLN3_9GAMM|nr:assimilatory sulfite reductase (NADPH) hemoprotein subunit [Ahniella affigens]AVP95757.1 sulfite reductase [Ahniella affigens]